MATVLVFDSIKSAGKQHVSAGSHALQTYKEAATQTFKAGAPLALNGSGLVAEITDPVADAEIICGVAAIDATGVTSTDIQVVSAAPGFVFEGRLGNVADDLNVTAQADVGTVAALRKAASGAWYVGNEAAQPVAGACVRIVGLKDPVGTVNGRVYFVFLDERQNAADAAETKSTIYA